jgi:hypothetical protein
MNQRGQNVMPGEATIALPSREFGTNPIGGRLVTDSVAARHPPSA